MKILRKKVKILDEIKEQVELIPDEGYVIIEKNPKEGEEQIYSPHLFLGFNDSVDNYVEILESEVPQIEEAYEELEHNLDSD